MGMRGSYEWRMFRVARESEKAHDEDGIVVAVTASM
jgi:hypothetical protein